jgi:hypothetical protein
MFPLAASTPAEHMVNIIKSDRPKPRVEEAGQRRRKNQWTTTPTLPTISSVFSNGYR